MLKEEIIEYSKKIGIDLIGFTDNSISNELKDKLILQQQLGYACDLQKGTIEEKTNLRLMMNDCQTIIAMAMAYSHMSNQLDNLRSNEVYFSSSSWGTDYHRVLKEKMELLCAFIKDRMPSFNYKIICDTSPLCDRTIAYKAGLGFFGINNLLINPKYGSNIFLGSILTNLDIESDKPLTMKCNTNCHRCIDNCPTKALSEIGILNANKCLSYITQKKVLDSDEEQLLNNCIYGCDICRSVCPYNNNSNYEHDEFEPSGIEFIDIEKYIPLSNKQFKAKYGHLSGAWRGAKIINRNISIYKDKYCKK